MYVKRHNLTPKPKINTAPNIEIIKLKNEIEQILYSSNPQKDDIESKVLELSKMQYSLLKTDKITDDMIRHKLELYNSNNSISEILSVIESIKIQNITEVIFKNKLVYTKGGFSDG